MLYNYNPRTIKDSDETKKRLKKEAEKETEAGHRKMELEEQRRKQLKINDKKREIDELTRGITSKESTLRLAVSELDMLESEKQREERKLKELEQKSAIKKPNVGAELAEKTSKLKSIDREADFLKQNLNKEKYQAKQRLSVREADYQDEKRKIDDIRIRIMGKTAELRKLEQEISLLKQEEQRHEQALKNLESQINPQDDKILKEETELSKKLQEEERLKKDLSALEKESKAKQKSGADTGVRNEKFSLERMQRRITAVGDNIKKINNELTGMKTELQKKTGELRALATLV